MEDFAHDLPRPVDFEKREHVGVLGSMEVGEFEPNGGNCFGNIDAGDPCLKSGCWTALVTPVKQQLYGAAKQVGAGIAKDRRVRVERRLYVVTPAGFHTVDVGLNDFGDCFILVQVSRYGIHGSISFQISQWIN